MLSLRQKTLSSNALMPYPEKTSQIKDLLPQLWVRSSCTSVFPHSVKQTYKYWTAIRLISPCLKLTMCLSIFLIESGLQPENQQSTFCHLPAHRRVPGSEEQAPLLISTALLLLGKHWQNPAQEYHLAFLQHFTNANQRAQHHQIR